MASNDLGIIRNMTIFRYTSVIDEVCIKYGVMMLKRTVIYPKDIQRITGKSERTGRRILERIRKVNGKEKHQLITVSEFSNYIGIDAETIQSYLTD